MAIVFFFFIAAVSFFSISTATEFQTLILRPLPNPSPLSSSEPESNSDIAAVTVKLHHLDVLSFNKTPEDLFILRLQRDVFRVKFLNSLIADSRNPSPRTGFNSSVISGLAHGSGEYFTRLGVGTPPKYVYMVLDTGSDVVWIQCSPCRKCYSQSDPIFDPSKSRSYKGIPCNSPLCRRLESSGCNRRKTCLYQVSYGDGSYTTGDFSTETLTFRGIKVERVAIGCGHDNEGLFVGAGGLLGLGRGRLSFLEQTGHRFDGKFSYCLVDRSGSDKPSSIVFGGAAVSRTARFTPLLRNPRLDTF